MHFEYLYNIKIKKINFKKHFFEQEKTGHYIVRHNETDSFFFNLKDKGEPQWRYLWDVRMCICINYCIPRGCSLVITFYKFVVQIDIHFSTQII